MYVLDGQQSTMKAMGWVRSQSVHNSNSDILPQDLELTKRTSPASTNGLVVNHSHMNALVELSFTESMSPRMSLFTDIR